MPLSDDEKTEYIIRASDLRAIQGALGTHLGIWLTLNTFWATLLYFAFAVELPLEQSLRWLIRLGVSVFAFLMNLAINISVARLYLSEKRIERAKDTLHKKMLDDSAYTLLKQIDKEIKEIKGDLYERFFEGLKGIPEPLYHLIGIALCIIWLYIIYSLFILIAIFFIFIIPILYLIAIIPVNNH